MENIYVIIVGVLFALAISDLIVGVSNDAVNFLNSALGAKAGSFKFIMTIAALGVLFGSVFSDGMMEVARKGIFNPQHFYFSEIMTIFLAVMITDIILLDAFNTLGLPTSTTVSIVFELLGAAVAISVIKLTTTDHIIFLEDGTQKVAHLYDYINTQKALTIIGGILLSVVIAFSVGAIVQWITRLLFTFDYEKKLKYFGSIWGGLAITAITYFILIKGAKHASFMSDDIKSYIAQNTTMLLIMSFVSWAILLQIITFVWKKFNTLQFIALVGTFALAVAFAGNDLVNFIGVPLASFESYKTFSSIPGADPDTLSMASLAGKVKTDSYLLVIAGLIMVATLYLSKKAKTVVKTSLDLSRQSEGTERFGSSLFARSVVKNALRLGEFFSMITPPRLRQFVDHSFDSSPFKKRQEQEENPPAFDLMRASVNLVVASVLISFATSLKLPLSTTYVTFMVAMGTSLADRAWGRESAVYRITGVLSVIGGWFFTAFSAFTVAFIVAYLINWGGAYVIIALIVLAIFLIYKSHALHKKKSSLNETALQDVHNITDENILEQCTTRVAVTLLSSNDVFDNLIEGIANESEKQLRNVRREVENFNKQSKTMKDNVYLVLKQLHEDNFIKGHYYTEVVGYLREIAHCYSFMADPAYEYFINNHSPLIDKQIKDLKEIAKFYNEFNSFVLEIIEKNKYELVPDAIMMQQDLIDEIGKYSKTQIKRVKKNYVGARNSMLYLALLHETKNIVLHTVNLLKSQRDFVNDNLV